MVGSLLKGSGILTLISKQNNSIAKQLHSRLKDI